MPHGAHSLAEEEGPGAVGGVSSPVGCGSQRGPDLLGSGWLPRSLK